VEAQEAGHGGGGGAVRGLSGGGCAGWGMRVARELRARRRAWWACGVPSAACSRACAQCKADTPEQSRQVIAAPTPRRPGNPAKPPTKPPPNPQTKFLNVFLPPLLHADTLLR
jgi:hypothetical protein